MRGRSGLAIEVRPRPATLVPERWPVAVPPAHDELLSSWLHRLAFAHGLSPRHFGANLVGDRVGLGSGAWSARLDLALPQFLLDVLDRQTDAGRDRIMAMTVGATPWRALLLPLRQSRRERTGAAWLQFCPACLAEDEFPYFRRAWRRASVTTCRGHGRALLDRCPSCRGGLAPFDQRALRPQSHCARCGFDFREAKAPKINKATREAAELIDDLVRLEAAKGFLANSGLIDRIVALPSLETPTDHRRFNRLSTRERLRCVAQIVRGSERRLRNHLCAEPNAVVAGWRRMMVAAGGATPTLEPVRRPPAPKWPSATAGGPKRRDHKSPSHAADLRSLLAAYGAVCAAREARKR